MITNKDFDEVLERNKDIIFTSFVSEISAVDIGVHTGKTFAEVAEFEKNNKLPRNSDTIKILELTGFKPFRLYGEILTDYINKVISNERDYDYMIKDKEKIDNWLERIKGSKNADLWTNLHANMFSLIIAINDSRVTENRQKFKTD